MMKLRHWLQVSALLGVSWVLSPTSARAETLYNGTTLVQGQESFVQSFNVTTPGTFTVTLSAIPWLDSISDLNSFVTTSSGVVGSSSGTGTESFDVSAGTVYAHWFGSAQGSYNIGALGVNIQFQPSATAVALPTSFILLLSGLGLLFGWQNRRTPSLQTA